ncbi:hypothetical protein EDD18DRAFT_1463624 [Armillaria luteobubalina]|uniref:NAD(P)-binding protein n=1 Tax=Armillaria luteobubalina TaxID=153913 RepID=A0AA39UN72_9AGAR|nr:hypothetical protein EDD18DRAFT_1463624 [Armillaria luteobubalina]
MGGIPSKTFNPVGDLPSLAGKVVIMTGSRLNEEGREPSLGEVIWHELGLIDPRSAKDSAERFIARETKLDILVNNAALIPAFGNVQAPNADGIDETMAISYLGPYIFTNSLLPLLESTASLDGTDVRIINVGSGGYRYAKNLEYDSKEAWNHSFKWYLLPSLQRYEYTKLALHLWTNNLARRLSEKQSKVLVMIAQPALSGWHYPSTLLPPVSPVLDLLPRRKDNPEIFQGAYIYPPNIAVPQEPIALDEDKQRKLVDFTEEFLQSVVV